MERSATVGKPLKYEYEVKRTSDRWTKLTPKEKKAWDKSAIRTNSTDVITASFEDGVPGEWTTEKKPTPKRRKIDIDK